MNDLFTGEPAKAKRGRKKAPAPPPQPEPEVSAPAEAGNGAELIVEDAQARAVQLFTDPKEYSEFYRRIAEEVGKHVPDTSTETGRDAIRSNAFKVTKAKTTLDKCALRLTEDWRLKTAAVNASRKIMVAELDQLAKEMRKPLTEWEALEDKRLDECRAQMEEFRTAAVIDPETDTAATLRERGKRIWEIEIDAGRLWRSFRRSPVREANGGECPGGWRQSTHEGRSGPRGAGALCGPPKPHGWSGRKRTARSASA
jgi:hypothetical protein